METKTRTLKEFQSLTHTPTAHSKHNLTPSQPHTKGLFTSVLFTCYIIPGFQPKNLKIC